MLKIVPALKDSMPKTQPVVNTATGISALSIWMKDTDRYMYAAFPSHKVPEQRTLDICRSLAALGKLICGMLSRHICHRCARHCMTLIRRLPTRNQGPCCSLLEV